MKGTWSLQDAKNRFSELVREALRAGPQVVTRRGKETAVVLSAEEYRRLLRPEVGLVEFMRSSPLAGVELDLDRDRDAGREVEL
ncbi:MAG TPA: type II toxin-antitoxin system Phd/YefM family antitoxin [Candidatus Sulfomarinibacteraceae bacterium]|nr:type II toxin-antitoxin system Phd/YefM family antitoxin [Candidatus Sulfomarinibacteraceae bacterium]